MIRIPARTEKIPMSRLTKTLVVGTTPDYIAWIQRESPGSALFLTDPEVWRHARKSRPPGCEEVLCDLSDAALVEAALSRHLNRENTALDGIACFDCDPWGWPPFSLAATVFHNLFRGCRQLPGQTPIQDPLAPERSCRPSL